MAPAVDGVPALYAWITPETAAAARRLHEHVAAVHEFQVLDGERRRRGHLQLRPVSICLTKPPLSPSGSIPMRRICESDVGRRAPFVLGA